MGCSVLLLFSFICYTTFSSSLCFFFPFPLSLPVIFPYFFCFLQWSTWFNFRCLFCCELHRWVQFEGAATPFRFRPALSSFIPGQQKEREKSFGFYLTFVSPPPLPPPPPLGRFGMGVTTLPVTMAIAKKSPFACHTLPPQLDWISTLSLVFPLLNDSVNRPTNESHWFLFKLQFVTFKQMSVTAHVIQLWCYRFQFVLVGGLILLITSS